MKPEVSQAHRRELLRFLLTKTAAVRSGVSGSAFLLTVPDTFFYQLCSHYGATNPGKTFQRRSRLLKILKI